MRSFLWVLFCVGLLSLSCAQPKSPILSDRASIDGDESGVNEGDDSDATVEPNDTENSSSSSDDSSAYDSAPGETATEDVAASEARSRIGPSLAEITQDKPTSISGAKPSTGPISVPPPINLKPSKKRQREVSLKVPKRLREQRFVAPLADAYQRIEPGKDGWETEAYSENVSAQLNRFAEAIEAGLPSPLLVAKVFASPSLYPKKSLEITYDDLSLSVRRSEEPIEPPGGAARGAERLSQIVSELREAIPGSRRASFTLLQVDHKAKGNSNTTALLHVSGKSPIGREEMTATCRIQWDRSQVKPLIRQIEIDEIEIVTSKGLNGFDDCTEMVLGNDPLYHDQFLYGTDHWRSVLPRKIGIDVIGDHGLAIGDVNGDSLEDIYVLQPGGLPNRLLIQQNDGRLQISTESGAEWMDSCASALLIDVDNDADLDLVVGQERKIAFMANDGKGQFKTMLVVDADSQVHSLAAADFDLDGDLDVFVCGYKQLERSDTSNMGEPIPYHDAENGGQNMLLQNNRSWEFENVAKKVGLADKSRFSCGASWEDYDKDGDPDLFVANEYGRNSLYQNRGERFVDVAGELGTDSSGGKSATWGDANRDGRMDIYVSNVHSAAGNRITNQREFKRGIDRVTKQRFQQLARGSSLFLGDRKGDFQDITQDTSVETAGWAWGSKFCDINNDGWEDIVVNNGFITHENANDASSLLWRQVIAQSPTVFTTRGATLNRYRQGWKLLNRLLHEDISLGSNETNQAFLNLRDGSFAKVGAVSGLDYADDSRALAICDWNFDGRLDLWTTARTAPRIRLLRNQIRSTTHFLAIRLQGNGTTTNRDAIGARVEVVTAHSSIPLTKTLHAGDGLLAQSSRWLHFGLGETNNIERVIVHWPGGASTEYQDVSADGHYVIKQTRDSAERWQPPSNRAKLVPSEQVPNQSTVVQRIVPTTLLPLPSIQIEGSSKTLTFDGPTLVNIWSSTCQICAQEMADWSFNSEFFNQNDLKLVAVNSDRANGYAGRRDASKILEEIGLSHDAVTATAQSIRLLDLFQKAVVDRWQSMPVPCSFLVDGKGRVHSIYKGPVDFGQLKADLQLLEMTVEQRRDAGTPFIGKWLSPPPIPDPIRVASQMIDYGALKEAIQYLDRYVELSKSEMDQTQVAEINYVRSVLLKSQGQSTEAILALDEAKRANPQGINRSDVGIFLATQESSGTSAESTEPPQTKPDAVSARQTLAISLLKQGKVDEARGHLKSIVEADPNNAIARFHLANTLRRSGDMRAAIQAYNRAIKSDPELLLAANNLAWILSTHPNTSFRNGKYAVRVSERMNEQTDFNNPQLLDTLSVATC